MLTPKQTLINAVLITYIDYSVMENYIRKMASFLPYTRPEPLLKVLHHIYYTFLWHSCNFFANGNFQIVIWPSPYGSDTRKRSECEKVGY